MVRNLYRHIHWHCDCYRHNDASIQERTAYVAVCRTYIRCIVGYMATISRNLKHNSR